MTCTILVSTNIDPSNLGLKMSLTPDKSHERTIDDIRVIVAGYKASGVAEESAETERLRSLMKGLLESMTKNDVLLFASHSSQAAAARHQRDALFASAVFSNPGQPLASALEEIIEHSRYQALAPILDWFWEKAENLPPQAFDMLRTRLTQAGPIRDRWNMIRSDDRIKRAVYWLCYLEPAFAAAPDVKRLLESLEPASEVLPAESDFKQLLRWVSESSMPNATAFRRFCAPSLDGVA